MDTIINVEQSSIEVVSNPEVEINTLQPNEVLITVIAKEPTEISFTDVGVQGIKGAQGLQGVGINYTWSATSLGIKREDEISYVFTNLKGDTGESLDFGDLTEEQKQELRGDVGETDTNYTNVFLASLLS